MLEPFTLKAEILVEDDESTTVVVNELEWAVNAPTLEKAVRELIEDLRKYAGDYLSRAPVYMRAPNRRRHFPYVLRVLLASTDEEIRQMLST